MTSPLSDQSPNISVIRSQAEIVLRGSTRVWKEICRAIEQLCATDSNEMSIPIRDESVSDKSAFQAVPALVIRRGAAPLAQSLSEGSLVIEGSASDLLALAENIDCPNPFEGAHYQSDSWTPGVSAESIPLVFMHVS